MRSAWRRAPAFAPDAAALRTWGRAMHVATRDARPASFLEAGPRREEDMNGGKSEGTAARTGPSRPRCAAAAIAALAGVLVPAAGAWAYIDQPPEQFTLPRLLLEFRSAGLYEVEHIDVEKGAIRFRPVEHIQGIDSGKSINHVVWYTGSIPPEFKNVKVGQRAVLFRDDPWGRAVTMLEGTWYVSSWDRAAGQARFSTMGNPFFECAFLGSVAELASACRALVRGEEIVVRCRPKPKAAETQWVATSLREPHKRKVVPAPAGALPVEQLPAGSPPAAPPKPAPASGDALPGLLEKLRDPQPRVRMEAAGSISRLGPAAKDAVAALVAAFPQEKDPFARRAMIDALGSVGPQARAAAPALAMAVRDGYGSVDDLVGFEAAAALAKIDPENVASGQYIGAMLRDKNPDVRCRAAAMVRLLGPGPKSLVPILTEAMKDPATGVRYEALRSLTALRPEPAVLLPILTAAIGDKDRYMRQQAAVGLASYGPGAKDALKPLMEAVAKEKEPEVKAQQIRALRYIGPAAAEAIPLLTEALKDPNPQVRTQAQRAIQKIRPQAAPATPVGR
jgi:HEAT repeat protein